MCVNTCFLNLLKTANLRFQKDSDNMKCFSQIFHIYVEHLFKKLKKLSLYCLPF